MKLTLSLEETVLIVLDRWERLKIFSMSRRIFFIISSQILSSFVSLLPARLETCLASTILGDKNVNLIKISDQLSLGLGEKKEK